MSTSFTFDAAELREVISEWTALRDEIAAHRDRFARLTGLAAQVPASDIATTGFLTSARSALDAAHGSHEAIGQYVDRYLEKLTNASLVYQATEDDNGKTFMVVLD